MLTVEGHTHRHLAVKQIRSGRKIMSFSQNGNVNEIIEEDEEDVDDGYGGECYYCGTQLGTHFDYFCISCERQACDNCCDACNAEEL